MTLWFDLKSPLELYTEIFIRGMQDVHHETVIVNSIRAYV